MSENPMPDPTGPQFLDWPSWARGRADAWARGSGGFRDFLAANEAKVRGKFSKAGADPEDQADVVAELEVAHGLLAAPGFSLGYEPGGGDGDRGPDYSDAVTGHSASFLEVKRVREAAAGRAVDGLVGALAAAARSVPSSLGLWIDLDMDGMPAPEVARRAEAARHEAAALCLRAIADAEASLPAGGSRDYGLHELGIAGTLTLESLPDKEAGTRTAYFGGRRELAYTQKEAFKFSELLASSLGQLCLGAANALVVQLDSATHEPVELLAAVHELGRKAAQGDDGYFRKNKAEDAAWFCRRWPALSAVAVLSRWGCPVGGGRAGRVWISPDAAVPLPAPVMARLQGIVAAW